MYEIATESIFSNLKSFILGKTKTSDMEFGKMPEKHPIHNQKDMIMVDNDKKIIAFRNINYLLLQKRITETYESKYLKEIFWKTYNAKDINAFFKKRRNRNSLRLDGFVVPLFFALELSILFSELGKKYRSSQYYGFAKYLYENTWIKDIDRNIPYLDPLPAEEALLGRFELKDYQLEFIKKYPLMKERLNLRGVYNAFDQGLGKTLTALSLAIALKVDKIYIVCPNNLVENWILEIKAFYGDNLSIANCKDKTYDLDSDIFIINNESIAKMYPSIDPRSKSILIVDEGHNFRDMNSTRFKDLRILREKLNPGDILLMSGTPLKASPIEIIPSLILLDPLFTTPAAMIYNKCFNLDGYESLDIINHRLGKFIYRKLKSEVLTLPNKIIEDMKLPVENPERFYLSTVREEVKEWYKIFYNEITKGNEKDLEEFKLLVNKYSTSTPEKTLEYIRRIERTSDDKDNFSVDTLHEVDQLQMTSFLQTYVLDNSNFPKNKVKSLLQLEKKLLNYAQSAMGKAIGKVYPPKRNELYNELFDNNKEFFIKSINNNLKKVIIFSQFAGVINHISEELSLSNVDHVKITGAITGNKRLTEIDRFKTDESCRVLVATSQTLGTGFTFTMASKMYFFGAPWRATDFRQCSDRIYRLGQDVDVYIYTILLDDRRVNISSKMNDILNWSSSMFDMIVDSDAVKDNN